MTERITTTTSPRTTSPQINRAPSMSDVAAGRGVMMRGHRGESVRQLQAMLKDMGYYKGELDGDFGSKTEAALKEFQKKHDLQVDGFLGKKSLEKLQSKEVQQDHGAPGLPKDDKRGGTNPEAEARAREYARKLAGEKLDNIRSRPWDRETLNDPDKRAARVASSRRDLESVKKYIDRLPEGEEKMRLQQRVEQLEQYYSKLEGRYYFQGLGSSIDRDANESARLEEDLKTQIGRGGRS